MLPILSCGGYVNLLQDIVMWFSSGGTKSVLHSDNVDNINCVFSGEKELYVVDKVILFYFYHWQGVFFNIFLYQSWITQIVLATALIVVCFSSSYLHNLNIRSHLSKKFLIYHT